MNKVEPNVKRSKVTKLLSDLPLVVWEEQIVPILQNCGQRTPSSNFNVYRYIKFERFVNDANERVFSKLLTFCLRRCNIKLHLCKDEAGETQITVEKTGDTRVIEAVINADRRGVKIEDVHTVKK